MGIKKQEIQDSGGGGWPSFAHRNWLRRVQDTYNYKMKPRICIYTSWTEVLFIFFMYLVSIYSTSHQAKA